MRCEGERAEGPQAEEGPRGMSAREVRALALPDGSIVEVCSLAGDIRAFPNHLHDHYVVGALYASRRALTVSARELHVLEPGDVFLVNPGDPHACDPLDDEPFSYRCANVPVGVMAALAKRGGEGMAEISGRESVAGGMPPAKARAVAGTADRGDVGANGQAVAGPAARDACAPRFAVPVLHDPALFARADAFFTRAAHEGPAALFDLDGLLRALLDAADAAAGGARACAEPGGPVAAARTFVDARYADRIALEDMAAVAGTSRYALVRAFKRELGITPGRYLTAVRVMHAKSLLEQGCTPVEAAGLAGFADQAHLGRVFRNVTGLTPARYRAACAGDAS